MVDTCAELHSFRQGQAEEERNILAGRHRSDQAAVVVVQGLFCCANVLFLHAVLRLTDIHAGHVGDTGQINGSVGFALVGIGLAELHDVAMIVLVVAVLCRRAAEGCLYGLAYLFACADGKQLEELNGELRCCCGQSVGVCGGSFG